MHLLTIFQWWIDTHFMGRVDDLSHWYLDLCHSFDELHLILDLLLEVKDLWCDLSYNDSSDLSMFILCLGILFISTDGYTKWWGGTRNQQIFCKQADGRTKCNNRFDGVVWLSLADLTLDLTITKDSTWPDTTCDLTHPRKTDLRLEPNNLSHMSG